MKNQKEPIVTIRSLEEKLLAPATRHSIVQLDKLLTDDFIEFGRSGKIFDKQTVAERIGKGETARMPLADFKIVILAPDALLATYCATKIEDDGQKSYSLRSSICRKTGDKWRMFFRQGTPTGVKPELPIGRKYCNSSPLHYQHHLESVICRKRMGFIGGDSNHFAGFQMIGFIGDHDIGLAVEYR
jgi:hypothetical protein